VIDPRRHNCMVISSSFHTRLHPPVDRTAGTPCHLREAARFLRIHHRGIRQRGSPEPQPHVGPAGGRQAKNTAQPTRFSDSG
jgi:hypothetical protein